MVWTAKWRLVDLQNSEAFHKAIHTPEEYLVKLRAAVAEIKANPDAYIEELTVDKAAGKVRRAVYLRGEMKRDSGLVDLNKEFEHHCADGRVVKGKIVLESETKLVCYEKGENFEGTATLELHGDELTVTHKCGDVCSVEKFKRV